MSIDTQKTIGEIAPSTLLLHPDTIRITYWMVLTTSCRDLCDEWLQRNPLSVSTEGNKIFAYTRRSTRSHFQSGQSPGK